MSSHFPTRYRLQLIILEYLRMKWNEWRNLKVEASSFEMYQNFFLTVEITTV